MIHSQIGHCHFSNELKCAEERFSMNTFAKKKYILAYFKKEYIL